MVLALLLADENETYGSVRISDLGQEIVFILEDIVPYTGQISVLQIRVQVHLDHAYTDFGVSIAH